MTLDAYILLSLAEVCVAFMGFIGIVVVLGGRSKGEWTPVDDVRFWTLMLNCLTPIALALLPLIFGAESYKVIGLIVGGTWVVLLFHQAISATRIPEASTKLAIFVMITTIIVYGTFAVSALWISNAPIHQLYLSIILWNLTLAIIFFVRLLRSERSTL
jgi:hypothetical protein